MRTMRPGLAAVLVALLCALGGLLAGCGGKDKHADAQATVPTAPTTTTTAPADPYAIPSDPSKIDADYVNRVLAALNHVYGDVSRKQVATGRLEESDLIPIRAIYTDAEFRLQASILLKSPVPPRDQLKDPIGDARMVVDHFLSKRADCMSAEVAYDFNDVLVSPPAPKPWYITLGLKDPGSDPTKINPTPWAFRYDGKEEADRCAS